MKIISPKVIPPRCPLLGTFCLVTGAAYWQFPGWAWGVLGVLIAGNWALWALVMFSMETYVPADEAKRGE